MPANYEDPLIRIQLGLQATEELPIGALIKRIRRQLSLARSGQKKLDWLVSMEFLASATLQVEAGQYVLCAVIPPPKQGDFVGYPDVEAPSSSPSQRETLRPFAAAENVRSVDLASDAEESSSQRCIDSLLGTDSEARDDELLGVLDAFDEDLDRVHGKAANDGSSNCDLSSTSGPASSVVATRGDRLGTNSATPAFRAKGHQRPTERLGDGASLADVLGYLAADLDLDHAPASSHQSQSDPRTVQRLPLGAAADLPVSEALEGIRRSSSFVREVQDVMQRSADLKRDMKALEQASGLDAGPPRRFIAAREAAFAIDIAGIPVNFAATPVRTTVGGDGEVVEAVVRLVSPRAQFDDFKAIIVQATGRGVPGGVTTGGRHEIRFAGLQDLQRGVLLILRGVHHELSLQLSEKISTATLERAPALVTHPGSWETLTAQAIATLQRALTEGPKSVTVHDPELPLFDDLRHEGDREAA